MRRLNNGADPTAGHPDDMRHDEIIIGGSNVHAGYSRYRSLLLRDAYHLHIV